jgi:hypothetical protein
MRYLAQMEAQVVFFFRQALFFSIFYLFQAAMRAHTHTHTHTHTYTHTHTHTHTHANTHTYTHTHTVEGAGMVRWGYIYICVII